MIKQIDYRTKDNKRCILAFYEPVKASEAIAQAMKFGADITKRTRLHKVR